ncbi:MAG TPA: GDP-L-fucose synthase [Chlamydiales bacterium]|nr:GDP-L-fucose synthase [Chlamydiales bacterium]
MKTLLLVICITLSAFAMEQDAKIYVAGHRGMVGSAIMRKLQKEGYHNIITTTSTELDLRNQQDVLKFFQVQKPAYVFLAAAKVGGILANDTYPAEFIRDNLSIELNVIDAAYKSGVKKLLLLGSSCIYPRMCPQPMKEDHLLTGTLEPTNEWYALAKICGVKLCQAYNRQYGTRFISCMPTNLYGPGDNYHLQNSHVLPALIRKFDDAKNTGAQKVHVWGTGQVKREFLHVDDLADACLFLMDNYEGDAPINVGWGKDISISNLAKLVQEAIGFDGQITYDISKPDGTPQKLLDTTLINSLGWHPQITLQEGLRQTIESYRDQKETLRR